MQSLFTWPTTGTIVSVKGNAASRGIDAQLKCIVQKNNNVVDFGSFIPATNTAPKISNNATIPQKSLISRYGTDLKIAG